MKEKILSSNFRFHSKCKKLNLSSTVFADDLFILANADIDSVKVIKDTLLDFQALSGLQPNLRKCEIFTSCINSQEKENLARLLGVELCRLLIKYLDELLITAKLSYSDCGGAFG